MRECRISPQIFGVSDHRKMELITARELETKIMPNFGADHAVVMLHGIYKIIG
jgi:hypothetical protein